MVRTLTRKLRQDDKGFEEPLSVEKTANASRKDPRAGDDQRLGVVRAKTLKEASHAVESMSGMDAIVLRFSCLF